MSAGVDSGSRDPTLDAVKSEDRAMVLDVLRVMQGLKCCSTYAVNPAARGYEVLGWMHSDHDAEVTLEQLELIGQVNNLRVKPVGVRVHAALNMVCVRVRVISLSEPCMMSETILLSVRKRSRWAED